MTDIPTFRVTQAKLFSEVGVDLQDPIYAYLLKR